MSRTWTDTTGQPRNFPSAWNPTDSEKIDRFGAFTSAAGTFVLSGDTLTFRPVSARFPGFEGGYSKDIVRIKGDTLTLTMFSLVASNGTPLRFFVSGGRDRERYIRER